MSEKKGWVNIWNEQRTECHTLPATVAPLFKTPQEGVDFVKRLREENVPFIKIQDSEDVSCAWGHTLSKHCDCNPTVMNIGNVASVAHKRPV